MVTTLKKMNDANEPQGFGETVKMVVGFTLGVAVDVALTLAFGRLIPPGKGIKKWLAKAGVFVISMMAGEKAEEYVYEVMEETREMFLESQREVLESGKIEIVKVEE